MNELFIEPGSSLKNHTGSWSTQRPVMKNKWPPCGQTCPASEDIQAWLALASESQWEAAWRKLTERNPFPAVMGRVCYHPCESACNRKHLDSAVNIHALERYIGDMALEKSWRYQKLSVQSSGQSSDQCSDQCSDSLQDKKIAIVGAGPAGFSCAYQLALRGYSVTIFDADATAGGTLYSGIPDYRLPKKVLKQEIDAIIALGVKLQLNCRIGEQVSVETLVEEYDALYLAIGARKPRLYQSGNYSKHNVMSGVNFLNRINHGENIPLPSQVAVIGGGNTAIDVARCAVRMGAKVTVVCAQDPHGAHLGHPGAEIPASALEVDHAEAEGVSILYRSAVSRLVRSGEHLNGVEISRVDKVHDRHGNFNPVFFSGTEEFLPAGLVVFAIGQEVEWHALENLIETNTPGVFVGGDAAGNARFAPTAIGSGFQGAMEIIEYLSGTAAKFEYHKKAEVSYKNLNLPYYSRQDRQEEKVAKRGAQQFKEIISGLDKPKATAEAVRCLSCGVCFQCDNCWHFCPDAAIVKHVEKYSVDYDYCKGCGICAEECPSGYIEMKPNN